MASFHSYQTQDFQVKKLGGLPKSPSKWYCHIATKPLEIWGLHLKDIFQGCGQGSLRKHFLPVLKHRIEWNEPFIPVVC